MSDEALFKMLQERERVLVREYEQARVDAAKLVAVADARLTEIRELIERIYDGRRKAPNA